MLAVELVQLRLWSIGFASVAVRNEADIHNARNRLKGVPQLSADELSTIRTQSFVVESQIHAVILILDFPHVTLALLRHLFKQKLRSTFETAELTPQR